MHTGSRFPLARWVPHALLLTLLVVAWRVLTVHQSGISLYLDEAQYWGWAQNLSWGYFSKPPGVAVEIYLSTSLFGNSVIGTKLLAMLCYPLVAWLALLVAREIYDEKVAITAALLVLTLPIFAWLGLFATTDSLLILFWTAGLLLYLRALREGSWTNWLSLGLVCGLGLLSKYTMLAWLASAFLHLLAFHRKRLLDAGPWLAAGLAGLILLPNLLWNVANDFPTLKHTADITVQRTAGGILPLLSFIGIQWLVFGPVFGSAFVASLVTTLGAARQGTADQRNEFTLIFFCLPLWGVASMQAIGGSANANWAAPAFVPASILVAAWLVRTQRRRWLVAGLSLNLIFTALAYHWPLISEKFFPELPSPYSRARGWQEISQQLRPFAAAHPGVPLISDGRNVLAYMQYELRDLPLRIASWNPAGTSKDHYQLTATFKQGDALMMTPGELDPAIAARFASASFVTDLAARAGPGVERQFKLYLLHDFKGY